MKCVMVDSLSGQNENVHTIRDMVCFIVAVLFVIVFEIHKTIA